MDAELLRRNDVDNQNMILKNQLKEFTNQAKMSTSDMLKQLD